MGHVAIEDKTPKSASLQFGGSAPSDNLQVA